MKQGAKAEALLPEFLQLKSLNTSDPEQIKKAEDYYFANYVNPQIEQAKAGLFQNGQNSGSYAGGLVGQMTAQGMLDKYMAGLQRQQMDWDNTLAGRQSYFSGGPSIAATQNAADVQRGLGIASLDYSANRDMNNYNLNVNQGLNGFNQQNYNNALEAIRQKNEQDYQRTRLFGGVLGNVGGLFGGALGKGFGSLFNRGGATAAPMGSPSYLGFGAQSIGDFGIGATNFA